MLSPQPDSESASPSQSPSSYVLPADVLQLLHEVHQISIEAASPKMTIYDDTLSEFSKKLADIASAIAAACEKQRLERVPSLVSAHLAILTDLVRRRRANPGRGMSSAHNRGAFILSWLHASPLNRRFEEINFYNEMLHVLGAVFQIEEGKSRLFLDPRATLGLTYCDADNDLKSLLWLARDDPLLHDCVRALRKVPSIASWEWRALPQLLLQVKLILKRGLQSRLKHPDWIKTLGDDVCRRITEVAVCGGPAPGVAISDLTRRLASIVVVLRSLEAVMMFGGSPDLQLLASFFDDGANPHLAMASGLQSNSSSTPQAPTSIIYRRISNVLLNEGDDWTRSKSRHTLRLIPPPPEAFHGREVLVDSIVGLITSGKCRRVELFGVGGIGKTCLATALLHDPRIVAHFGSRRIFLDCTHFKSAPDLISELEHHLTWSRATDSHESLTSAFERWTFLALDSLDRMGIQNVDRGTREPEPLNVLAKLWSIPKLVVVITARDQVTPADHEWLRTAQYVLGPISAVAARRIYSHLVVRNRLHLIEDSSALDTILESAGAIPLIVWLLAGCDTPLPTLRAKWEEAHRTSPSATHIHAWERAVSTFIEVALDVLHSRHPEAVQTLHRVCTGTRAATWSEGFTEVDILVDQLVAARLVIRSPNWRWLSVQHRVREVFLARRTSTLSASSVAGVGGAISTGGEESCTPNRQTSLDTVGTGSTFDEENPAHVLAKRAWDVMEDGLSETATLSTVISRML